MLLKPVNWLRPISRVGSRNKCTAVKLTNRSVIRLAGEESRDFLQGLITNDIQHLGSGPAGLDSLFLNKAGRVLYDAIIYSGCPDTEGDLFVETDRAVGQELRKHLMIYRVRRKIAIDLVDDEYAVWAGFGENPEALENSISDPRLKDLGKRLLTRQENGVSSAKVTVGTLQSYNEHRYKLGVPEGVKEIVPGKAFPLEHNCDYMHGLSVHKGCYLGQEFTARTYHTGVVRKRIMPVELELPQAAGEDLVNAEVVTIDGRASGKIRGLEGQHGIGLLRIEMALGDKNLKANKTVGVRTWKPTWWPQVAPNKGSLE